MVEETPDSEEALAVDVAPAQPAPESLAVAPLEAADSAEAVGSDMMGPSELVVPPLPGDEPDLLDRVATAIGSLFEDSYPPMEDTEE